MAIGILAACLVAPFLLAVDEWVVKESLGPIIVQVRGPEEPVSLSDQFSIRVTITRPPKARVDVPAFISEISGARLASTNSFGPDATGAFLSQAWQFQIEPMRPGKINLPALRINYQLDGDAVREKEIHLPSIEIAADGGARADPSSLRPMPRLTEQYWTPTRMLFGAGIAVLIATILIAVIPVRRRRPAGYYRSQSLNDLTLLEEGELVDEKRFRESIVAISNILRGYLEKRYRLSAWKMTTPEFLSRARTTRSLGQDSQWRIEQLLPLIDVEKFGPGRPTEVDFLQVLDMARQFLESESAS